MARCCADNNETMAAAFPMKRRPPTPSEQLLTKDVMPWHDICTIRINARVPRQTPCFIASLEAAKVRLLEMELGYIL